MNKMDIMFQIHTGGFLVRNATFKQVREKLEAVLPIIPSTRVFMGWSPEPEIYQETALFLKKRGIECWLWLPVFSETGMLVQSSPVIGISGKQTQGYQMAKGENFDFCCPNCPENIQNTLDLFGKYFASFGFDGIFLDKIRYPSFVSGYDGGVSCFCPRCMETYDREGLDVEALKAAPFGVTGYKDGEYTFENQLWSRFFTLKSRIVTHAVSSLCKAFKDMGYKTGLDVFAPFSAAFVGQDIISLSKTCDFIKPMMYRATYAPAGLPFELDALARETADPDGFYRMLGLNRKEHPFNLAFAVRELGWMVKNCSCPVYAGLEINRVPGIADVDPAYVRETLAAYSAAAGAILSWNILDAPEENIKSCVVSG